jgi:hypothetical protein
MYGWMSRYLLNQGDGQPIAEGDVTPLGENDARLLCDPQGSVVPRSSTVVELAHRKAMEAIGKLSAKPSASRLAWVRELAAPPEELPHYLFPDIVSKTEIADGVLEKISFVSEDGEYIPGLLWLPRRQQPAPTVVIVDDRGKQAVATSGLVEPLLKAGHAVLAVDLRGRGETLGRVNPRQDKIFRLIANQVLFGQPLAGRRAFDLTRALDYISQRKELLANDLSVVGFGEDALPALIAAAADSRIRRLALSGYFHSFVSQMKPTKWHDMPARWNSAERLGKVNAEQYDIDLGSVIPWALETADVPDLVSLVAPRRVLFSAARDNAEAAAEPLRARFTRAMAKPSVRYEPAKPLDAGLLIEWLQQAP